MRFIVSRDPEFLKDMRCFCGKPAEVAWHLPVEKPKPRKISKTDEGPVIEPKAYPYGRSCEEHMPELD